MAATITVLGATGGIGAAITRAAEAHGGLRVRAVNRSASADVAATTERIAADIETTAGARSAVGDIRATPDADHIVVLAAQPPYHAWGDGRFERLLDNVLAATAAVGGKLVFVDNLYAFDGTAGPITERSPRATNRKGALREAMARRALAAHERGELRVTIGGFSDYLGPRPTGNAVITQLMVEPALAGKRMRALYAPDVPHAWAYLPDMAAMFLTLALDERADGRRWVLPHGEAATQRHVQELVAEAAGTAAKHGTYGAAVLWVAARFDKDIREVTVVRNQWEHPWEVDGSAFTATFGPHVITPLDEAVQAAVAGERSRRPAEQGATATA